MQKIRLTGIAIGLFMATRAMSAQSVVDLYFQAKKNHQSFKRVALEREFQQERLAEMKSGLLPTVSLQSTSFYGDKTLINQSGLDRLDHQQNFNMSLSLYNGGSEYTYFDYKKILPRLADAQVDVFSLRAFLEINSLFFDLMRNRNEKTKLLKQVGALEAQVKLLRERSAIGRNRKTEYLSALTTLKRLEARIREIEDFILSFKIQLEERIGEEVDLEKLSVDFDKFDSLPGSMRVEKHGDFSFRPDFKLLDAQLEQQKLNEDIATAEWRPVVFLDTNVYLNRRQFGRQDDWDISLNLRWNLYDFGGTSARVQQEKIRTMMLSYQKDELQSELVRTWNLLKTQFESRLQTRAKLSEAYQTSEKNYREHLKEFKSGLINNIEVMRSLDELIESERQWDQIRYTIGWHWYVMQAFLGNLPL